MFRKVSPGILNTDYREAQDSVQASYGVGAAIAIGARSSRNSTSMMSTEVQNFCESEAVHNG